jgi:hypothetical protein
METKLDIPEILEVVEITSQIRTQAKTYEDIIKIASSCLLKDQCPDHFSPGQRELAAALLTLQTEQP